MLVVTPALQIPEEELEFRFVRSSGPGGQNVNKVSTKAVLRWNPTTSPSLPEGVRARFLARYGSKLSEDGSLQIASDASRSQLQNRRACLEQLGAWLLAVAVPPKKRTPTRPTRGAKERRLAAKRRRADTKRTRGAKGED